MSIRAIADAVGVTPPSLYLHFADKDELIFEVCQAQFQRLHQAMDDAAAGIDDPVAAFKERGRAYVRFGIEHPEQYRILFMTKTEFTADDFFAGTMPGVDSFRSLMAEVEELQRLGVIAEGDPLLMASGIWAVVHGVTSLCISFGGEGFPVVGREALIEHCLETLMHGLHRPA